LVKIAAREIGKIETYGRFGPENVSPQTSSFASKRRVEKIDIGIDAHRNQCFINVRRLAKSQKREERVRTIVRVARLAERTAPLIVPNRPDERSATHGHKHGVIRARRRNEEPVGT